MYTCDNVYSRTHNERDTEWKQNSLWVSVFRLTSFVVHTQTACVMFLQLERDFLLLRISIASRKNIPDTLRVWYENVYLYCVNIELFTSFVVIQIKWNPWTKKHTQYLLKKTNSFEMFTFACDLRTMFHTLRQTSSRKSETERRDLCVKNFFTHNDKEIEGQKNKCVERVWKMLITFSGQVKEKNRRDWNDSYQTSRPESCCCSFNVWTVQTVLLFSREHKPTSSRFTLGV